jgi:hypothetical protein
LASISSSFFFFHPHFTPIVIAIPVPANAWPAPRAIAKWAHAKQISAFPRRNHPKFPASFDSQKAA